MFHRLEVVADTPKRFEAVFTTYARGLKWALLFFLATVGFFPLTIAAILIGQRVPQLPMPIVYFGLVAGLPWLAAELLSLPLRRRSGGKFRLEPGQVTIAGGCLFPWECRHPLQPGCHLSVNLHGDEHQRWKLELWTHGQPRPLLWEPDLSEGELRWLRDRGNAWLQASEGKSAELPTMAKRHSSAGGDKR